MENNFMESSDKPIKFNPIDIDKLPELQADNEERLKSAEKMEAEVKEELNKTVDFQKLFNNAKSMWDKRDVIRLYYNHNERYIIDLAQKDTRKSFNLNYLPWTSIYTPIETYAWGAIRSSHVVMYPQYPVLQYIVDFGNPYFKIGLELDGKQFHNRDSDSKRDQQLFELAGWKIFRVTGSDANREIEMPDRFPESYDDEALLELREFMFRTVEGVIEALDWVYFNPRPVLEDIKQIMFYELCREVLEDHKLANFEIERKVY